MRTLEADPRRIANPYALTDFDHVAWHAEIDRLRRLPGPFLGGALLRLVRQVRADHADLTGPHDQPSNLGAMFWYGLPELARRLGAPGLWPIEGGGWLRDLIDHEFRERLCAAMRAQAYFNQIGEKSPAFWRCVAPPGRGNIVAIAMDRIAPADPRPHVGDYLAEMIERTGTTRLSTATMRRPVVSKRIEAGRTDAQTTPMVAPAPF